MFDWDLYYKILLSNIRHPIFKVEILHDDERVLDEITQSVSKNTKGNLTINVNNGIRRSVNFALVNVNKRFLPSVNGLIKPRRKFKLWLGFKKDGKEILLPQGVFVMENPQVSDKNGEQMVHIVASDKFSLLDGTNGGELEGTYFISKDYTIYQIIRDLLQLKDENNYVIVNDVKAPELDIAYNTETPPYDKYIDSTVGDILLEFAKMLSANVYYNINGELVFEKDRPDNQKGSLWDFERGQFNYIEGTQNFNNKDVFNSVLIRYKDLDGIEKQYRIINDNDLSDTSIYNMPLRTKKMEYPEIYNEILAQDRGKYDLKQLAITYNSIDFTFIPMYHLEEDGVVTLINDKLNLLKDRYLIRTLNIPFGIGTASGSITKTSELEVS